jgi:ferredoxin
MSYVVTEQCIKCKFTDCVEVCPVDCFFEGDNMLVIDTESCIDCGVCEPECPADAIKADTLPGMVSWLEHNQKYSKIWPSIVKKKDSPEDAQSWIGVENKLEKYFNPDSFS